MAWVRRILLLLLFPIAAFGQGMRYDNIVLKPLAAGGVTPVSGALITVCTSAGTGTPCTPKVAQIYSDEALTTTITGTGGAGTTNSDANGNFGFYLTPGSYIATVTGSGFTSYTIKIVLPAGLATNNNFTGQNSSQFYKTDGIFWVDNNKYTTVDAARIDATATGVNSLVIIPSNYGGVDCPSVQSNSIAYWDFRSSVLCTQNAVTWMSTSGLGLFALERPIISSPTVTNNGSVAFYVQNIANNATASGASSFMDGIASELDVSGTLSGTIVNLQPVEHDTLITSTGGAITNAKGGIFYVNQPSGTTPVTTVRGIESLGCNNVVGGHVVNCRAGYFERQTAGTGTNYAIEAVGLNRIDYDSNAGAGGFSFEDTSHTIHNTLFMDASNNLHLRAIATQGTILEDSAAATQLTVTSTGLSIAKTLPLPNNTVALTADWTCGTAGTVSSCVVATIIGSGGGVPLTFTLPLIAQSYTLECDGVVGQATAATANQWNLLTATNGATNVTANYSMNTAATAMTGGAVTDQASTTTTFQITPSWTLGGTATKMPFHIWAKIEGASVSGTVVSLQLVAPTVGDLVTIYRGTACRVF